MADGTFTTEENTEGVRGGAQLLWRYLREVPFLKGMLVPNLIFAFVGAITFQLFLFLAGKFAAGEHTVVIPLASSSIAVSLRFLLVLALGIIVIRIIQWSAFEAGGSFAALPFYRRVIRGIGRTRTTFFDEFPSGKIINRLVNGFDKLKTMAPIRLGDSCSALVELVVAAGVISYASPYAALLGIPVLALFFYLQRNIAPMLQRGVILRSVRFGEVLHRETDVIEGGRVFLLYGQTQELFRRLRDAVYRYMQMHFLRGSIEAWGRFWADASVALFGFASIVAVFIGVHTKTLSPVIGVLVISAVFRLSNTFSWLTWSFGFLLETAGDARRVFEYMDLPPEETEEGMNVPPSLVPGEAPSDGDIEFDSYTMSYRPSTPIILEGLTLRIKKGSKVGLVGRTGSGKTSIVQSLFRMTYVHGGDIRVGGGSLFSVAPAEARALFTVVPQDPYLFEGTLRQTLDRYSQYADSELKEALRSVRLELSLDLELREGGSNVSQGERQLISLARVVLTKKPIVVMDEPTSGVDTITDAIIQSVLRTTLHDRTVITIAHRPQTLSRYDRIIELKDGAIIRDGTPGEILPLLTSEDLE